MDQPVKQVIPSQFYGLVSQFDENNNIYYKNKNFTSTEYYSNTYMMSHTEYWFFLTIGSRGRGKTFSGKKYCIKFVLDQIENGIPNGQLRKFMWWRLTTDAITKVIQNNGATFFEKELLNRYQIKFFKLIPFKFKVFLNSCCFTNVIPFASYFSVVIFCVITPTCKEYIVV